MTNLRLLSDLFRAARKLAAACAFAIAITILSAQTTLGQEWNTSGSDISNANSGNVGVGTSTPTYKFDVLSTTNILGRFGSTAAAHNQLLINAPSGFNSNLTLQHAGLGKWYLGNRASDNRFSLIESTGAIEVFTILQNGNVGIGTSSPAALVDLKGSNTPYVGQLRIAANDYGQITFYDSANLTPNEANRKSYIFHDVAGGNLNIASTGNIIISSTSYVGIGKSNPTVALDVQGDIKASGTIFAKYQDLAEWVPSSEQLSAGTVVVLDTTKSNQVISSGTAYDTRVAGVISAQPGITLGEGGEGKVLVATTGRVRVKVDASRGAIQIGDLLVTSDMSGVAMKSEPVEFAGRKMHMPGTIIGKALEPLAKGSGEILVLLSLQ